MKVQFLLALFLTISVISNAQVNNPQDITGEWLTAAKDVKILIYEEGGRYFGKVTWGIRELGKDTRNPEEAKRSLDILGSILLKDVVFNGKNKWEDGKIYDPTSGKTYSCVIKLADSNTLEMRGYIGTPLLGKTETWSRSL